jgi:mannose-1-phosphate guanylyltransferase
MRKTMATWISGGFADTAVRPEPAWRVAPAEAPEPEGATRASNLWAVVLAGGQGTRLQAFLRQTLGTERPKQFCRIIGTRSMLRHTWDRGARLLDPDRMVTIVTAGQEQFLQDEDRVPGRVLVQPANKETAPGLLLPLLWIAQRDPRAVVAIFPADHFIWEEERFMTHVRAAVRAAQRYPDRLVVLGVEADGPDHGYGWMVPGLPCSGGGGVELYQVRRFWEKPDRQTAAHLFASGHFWNTFVLAGRLGAFLRSARSAMPDVFEPLSTAAAFLGTRYQAEVLATTYRTLRPVNFSRTLLAGRPGDLLMLPARGVYWSDWGDPDRILRTLRRFNHRPHWLPAYARMIAEGAGLPG